MIQSRVCVCVPVCLILLLVLFLLLPPLADGYVSAAALRPRPQRPQPLKALLSLLLLWLLVLLLVWPPLPPPLHELLAPILLFPFPLSPPLVALFSVRSSYGNLHASHAVILIAALIRLASRLIITDGWPLPPSLSLLSFI